MPPTEASQALYARLGTEASVSGELPLPYFLRGAPLTQSLSNRASEAGCWMLLALAHMYSGQMQASLRSGRRSLALAQESKDAWQQVTSTSWLAYGLLEVGASEEALGLIYHTLALAQTFPWSLIRYRFLISLGSVYHALQQSDEARKTLEEVEMGADLVPTLVAPLLSQLCMHFAESGEWVTVSAMPCKPPPSVSARIWHCSRRISSRSMKRRPCCVRGRSARREPQCNDWGNVWALSALPPAPPAGDGSACSVGWAQRASHQPLARGRRDRRGPRLASRTVADPGEVGRGA